MKGNIVKSRGGSNAPLKLLKTITLEEDVNRIDLQFDKPLDEVRILLHVAFSEAASKAFAARSDSGTWYMFYEPALALKTTPRYFYAHAKEIGERRWEASYSGTSFSDLQGAANATTTQKMVISTRGTQISRYVNKLQIFFPNNSETKMLAGSTIEIWGHEADE